MKCGEEGRLYGTLKQKYDQMIKDQSMEELDIVDSKAPPPTLDSSSGDTDLDADSSVLHIDLNVDNWEVLWLVLTEIANHALHRQRIRTCQRRERLSHKKNHLSPSKGSRHHEQSH